ncbi:helix-turn-helix domain-containing protein [Amycolatopsis pithecellobii]|uniref:Helix-turn-helix domain-containing protein n=1 Tax=Amycolatopsis pithecellobii TaxID=664692 RepID=A0A6N7YS55_9PSEU|nr:helix-turn-helix transcriptional regulator [Amycolatopsis pithecellobii]MTD55867.1 helix-turn-helix domain-containing protein [Amycolatopsis pithecellobii]
MTSEFGALLRGWRDSTSPASVGAIETARRSPGLRREELAGLAGLSVDYLVQLEQGRAVRPSAHVVSALCRALRLSGDDAALLHQAAGLAVPAGAVTTDMPPGVERLLRRLDDWPVAVYSADWWLLRWNALWAALLGDPAALLGRARNLIWHEFTDTPARVVLTPAERAAFRDALVADLRVASIEHPDDPGLRRLVAELRTRSTDFAARWTAGRPARHRTARKRVEHPRVGRLTLDSDVLQTPGSALHIIAYSAEPDSEDAGRLDLLRVLGTEAFAH